MLPTCHLYTWPISNPHGVSQEETEANKLFMLLSNMLRTTQLVSYTTGKLRNWDLSLSLQLQSFNGTTR